MDRLKFYEIINYAESKGYKKHLDMLPDMPLNKTSYDSLASKIFWQRRFEIMFSHEFAKIFFGKERVVNTSLKLTEINWKYELKILVLEKNPFKYLKQYYDRRVK